MAHIWCAIRVMATNGAPQSSRSALLPSGEQWRTLLCAITIVVISGAPYSAPLVYLVAHHHRCFGDLCHLVTNGAPSGNAPLLWLSRFFSFISYALQGLQNALQ